MKTRLPPEWHPQSAVWVSPPRNAETWPGCLDAARAQFERFIAELRRVVTVRTTDELGVPTLDAWVRDYGPLFTLTEDDRLHVHDFRFNSYGHKYDPPRTDDAVTRQLAERLGLPRTYHDVVLEGGSIEVNGDGVLMTTASCLLNPNRNPRLSRRDLESLLSDTLGVDGFLWLDGPLSGDDTDGHIDTLARFIGPDVIAAPRTHADDPDHALLEHNWRTLTDDRRFELVALPTPRPIVFDFPGDRFTPPRRERLPAGYANFLIANGSVFVPTYGQPADDDACRALDDAMPSHRVVPIPSDVLVVGQGVLHCLTMQQPAAREAP